MLSIDATEDASLMVDYLLTVWTTCGIVELAYRKFT